MRNSFSYKTISNFKFLNFTMSHDNLPSMILFFNLFFDRHKSFKLNVIVYIHVDNKDEKTNLNEFNEDRKYAIYLQRILQFAESQKWLKISK